MGIEDSLNWYQKKIGTYDKQQWENTVEQRILHGLSNIQLKTATPKHDLIDLDLIRGSSFTKAKPKHGFHTVFRLSVLRILFLPLYAMWWARQTSNKIFYILLGLYLLQLGNISIWSYSTNLNIPASELVVPILMLWIFSFVHSQIVATNPGSEITFTNGSSFEQKRVKHRRKQRKLGSKVSKLSGVHPRLIRDREKNVFFKDDIITNENSLLRRRKQRVDDDGFESLNGTSDSDLHKLPSLSSFSRKRNSGIRCNEWVHSLPLQRRQSAPDIQYAPQINHNTSCHENVANNGEDTESENSISLRVPPIPTSMPPSQPLGDARGKRVESTCDTDEEGECETISSPDTVTSGVPMGLTTNSEDCSDCSYSSGLCEDEYDMDAPTNSILSPYCGPSGRVSCTIWARREIKKADLSVVEISAAIIARVESTPPSTDCFYLGIAIISICSTLPLLCRWCNCLIDIPVDDDLQLTIMQLAQEMLRNVTISHLNHLSHHITDLPHFGNRWECFILFSACLQRFTLGFFLFFLLSVAERTFKQRFLYAKLFSHLTSSRRARKSDLPHFRLNKVRNIITWLSVRSYLRKRGPQRSVEVIVSTAFIATLLLLSIICMESLKESYVLSSQYSLEVLCWAIGLGCLVLRFLILGAKINKKYRNLSVLITEQINLYLQIEQKPNKKEELMAANNVLKLAADLLKELESQFKILGLSANPVLYNITKVVILSALSGVLSEVLGFKLKLHKIKLK